MKILLLIYKWLNTREVEIKSNAKVYSREFRMVVSRWFVLCLGVHVVDQINDSVAVSVLVVVPGHKLDKGPW